MNAGYDSMNYRKCGRSGIRLPELTLGMWHNFGAVDDYEEGRRVVIAAFESGIVHFDLANNYGPPYGSAELTMGKILKQDLMPHRDELFISSKAGYDMWPGPYGDGGSRKYLIASLDQSLKRLGLEYVDLFYHHRQDSETPLEETMGALAQIVRSGKALYAGLSNYSASEARRAIGLLSEMNVPCLVYQGAYNMLRRDVEAEHLEMLHNAGVGFVAFSPLAQGLLTGKYNGSVPKGSRAHRRDDQPSFIPDDVRVFEQLADLKKLAEERGQSLPQLALQWLLRDERVTSVIFGARTVQQLKENLMSTEGPPFDEQTLQHIDHLLTVKGDL